ncbi:MAG: carboxypeptidase M32 [Gammaproteobacteria bacterium]|nr:carboxypeptidase M32 [Gammaproteobacteria bacterium]
MALSPYKQLELEWKRLHALRGAVSLLRWDAAVMMPRGSAAGRGEQIAALETECHAVLTSPKVSRLLERAVAGQGSLEEWEIANLREMRRHCDHAIAMPVSLLNKLIRTSATAESAWSDARQQNKFELFAPHLEEVVRLVREKAALLGQARSMDPYDALVDEFSTGVSSELIENLFKTYSRRLPELVREVIAQQEAIPVLPLTGSYKARQQRALINEVLRAIGFPFDRGRIDEASHAFTEGISGDIRITYCLSRQDPFIALLGALHETGHALYDLGLPKPWLDQPVGQARGIALEESQSLFLEMILGRSRAFVRYLRPLLEKHFGGAGPEWSEDNLYRLLTRVRRSAIRVDADELTYPLHVMLRFDLERRMLQGRLAVRDLREAWNEEMRQRLDLVPVNDAEGVLQDAHWASGSFGYFPLYMVGVAVAAQLAEQMRRDLPEFDDSVSRGDFVAVCGWLRDAIHAQGARLSLTELMDSATRKPLTATAALRYLERKYLDNSISI